MLLLRLLVLYQVVVDGILGSLHPLVFVNARLTIRTSLQAVIVTLINIGLHFPVWVHAQTIILFSFICSTWFAILVWGLADVFVVSGWTFMPDSGFVIFFFLLASQQLFGLAFHLGDTLLVGNEHMLFLQIFVVGVTLQFLLRNALTSRNISFSLNIDMGPMSILILFLYALLVIWPLHIGHVLQLGSNFLFEWILIENGIFNIVWLSCVHLLFDGLNLLVLAIFISLTSDCHTTRFDLVVACFETSYFILTSIIFHRAQIKLIFFDHLCELLPSRLGTLVFPFSFQAWNFRNSCAFEKRNSQWRAGIIWWLIKQQWAVVLVSTINNAVVALLGAWCLWCLFFSQNCLLNLFYGLLILFFVRWKIWNIGPFFNTYIERTTTILRAQHVWRIPMQTPLHSLLGTSIVATKLTLRIAHTIIFTGITYRKLGIFLSILLVLILLLYHFILGISLVFENTFDSVILRLLQVLVIEESWWTWPV